MKDENKTKKQLINKLIESRQRTVELEETYNEFKKTAEGIEKESESVSMELAISLFEVFEALKKISSGDPDVRISEESEIELISKLKHMVNLTAENIGEIVIQSHEFAMVLAEHFDVLHRVSKGDLSARISGESRVELLEALKKVTNEMIESIDRETTKRKQMEEELAESEEQYRRLFETSKDGLLLLDRETRKVMTVNPAIVELLGYSGEELTGKGLKDVSLLKYLGDFEEIIQKLDKVGYVYCDDVPVETKTGKSIDTEIYLINRAKVIQCNIRDITERKQVQQALVESENKFRSLTDKALVGVYIIQDGVIKYINAKGAEIHGYTVEEMVDKIGPKDWVLPEDRPLVEENIRRRTSGEIEFSHYECRIITKKQEIRNVEILGSRTMYQGRMAVMGTLLDITDRKNAEKEIKKRVKELEEFYDMAVGRELRIKELKEEMEELKEQMERLRRGLDMHKEQ